MGKEREIKEGERGSKKRKRIFFERARERKIESDREEGEIDQL